MIVIISMEKFSKTLSFATKIVACLLLLAFCLTKNNVILRNAFAASPTAILSVTPASGTVTEGSTIPVDIVINTGGQGVAAVRVTVDYPSNLTYTSSDLSSSVFPTSVTPV